MESPHDGTLQAVATFAIAGLAAVVKYVQRFTATPRPAFDWIVFAIQITTSVLAGFIASWLFNAWNADPNLAKAAIAIAGWGGAEIIEAAERRFKRAAEGSANNDAAN